MRRVVVTGYGILSSIGYNRQEVRDSLYNGTSGIVSSEEFAEGNLRSHVHGKMDIDLSAHIDRKMLRFMGDAAAYAYLSMKEAIEHAGLSEEQISNPRTGLITGIGGTSIKWIEEAINIFRTKGPKRVGPYMVPRTMSSTVAANLATAYKIKGVNYSISSACATSAHCIGNAIEQIQENKQDVVFAGGGEELYVINTVMFDAMGALSSHYNDTPEKASRPYDKNRDGFVIAAGGGIVVLEELEHAKARGATILGELVGYGATSDGADMVAPSGEGAIRCMQIATENVDEPIDYINTHGTSTPAGDIVELKAIREALGDNLPKISSTKSLTGHSLGATSVHELIYCLIMLEEDFIAASANIDELDPDAADFPIVTERIDNAGLNVIMSNSFGFGGTNATLTLKRYAE